MDSRRRASAACSMDKARSWRPPALSSCGLAFLSVVALSGCCMQRGTPPRDAREALERIQSNLEKIDRALAAKATASFRFRDERGAARRFWGHPAALRFEPPRCLLFDIRATLGGTLARIGSNDERYWVWVDAGDLRRLVYGSWAALERGAARPMTPPADELLDALMLRPLPDTPALRAATLRVAGRRPSLVWQEGPGSAAAMRELRLDPCPPYMPLEVIDRDASGAVAMHATLGAYRPVETERDDPPLVARKYVILWPTQSAELRIDLTQVRFSESDVPFCDFPARWRHEVECLDLPAGEAWSRAATERAP